MEPTDDVPIRPASSVLLLREHRGLEVFVQHRVATMDFAAGVAVFPGGRVDPVDSAEAPGPQARAHAEEWRRSDYGATERGAAALLRCAVREVAEETGLLLDPGDLRPWANWVTPPGQRRRFDTYFYTATPAMNPEHLTTEASHSEWRAVTDLLGAHAAGVVALMPPTLALLRELGNLGSVEAVLGSPRDILPVRRDDPRH